VDVSGKIASDNLRSEKTLHFFCRIKGDESILKHWKTRCFINFLYYEWM